MPPDSMLPDGAALIYAVAVGFFMALDRFEDERLLDLVTEEVEWVRPGGVVRGRDEVRRVLANRSRARVTRHLLTNVDWRPAGPDKVTVRYDVLVFDHTPGAASCGPAAVPGPSQLLSGEDVFVRQAENWLIARKQAGPVFTFPK